MNDNENKPQRDYSPIYRLSAVLIAISAIVICFALARVDDFLLRIILFSVAAFLDLLAVSFISAAITVKRAAGRRINFFLYDKKKKTNLPVDTLTFEEVRKRLCKYMSMFSRRGKLFVGDLFDDSFNIPRVFKPLFCYELLLEMADSEMDAKKTALFLSFGKECADAFSEHLSFAGDTELSCKLQLYFADYESGNPDVSGFYSFIVTQKDALKSSMMSFIKEHIKDFE